MSDASNPAVPDPSAAAPFGQLSFFGGLDWAQVEHQLIVVDLRGQIVLSLRFANDPEGWSLFRQKIVALGGPLGVAIETSCGPAVEWSTLAASPRR